ncbi:MAG: glycosyltransferase family 2 protein [Candidatus Hydrogenedentota bacterium]
MEAQSHTQTPALSVVVPVYNEEQCLPPLREELVPVLERLETPFEIIFVDDGSTDGSWPVIRRFCEEDSRMCAIRFIRNFGQQMALTAGLRFAKGQEVVLIDADMEVPPENIPPALDKLREGYDIVFGMRSRRGSPWHMRVLARLARWFTRHLTGFQFPDSNSGFLALRASLVQTVSYYNEFTGYLKGLFTWLAFGRYACLPVTGRPRLYGRNKFDIRARLKHLVTFITGFSAKPLYLSLVGGAVVGGVSLGLIVLAGILWAQGGWVAGEQVFYLALLTGVGSLQLFALGILGEYVGRIYLEVRKHPPYVIAEILERDAPDPDAA